MNAIGHRRASPLMACVQWNNAVAALAERCPALYRWLEHIDN